MRCLVISLIGLSRLCRRNWICGAITLAAAHCMERPIDRGVHFAAIAIKHRVRHHHAARPIDGVINNELVAYKSES